MSITLMIITLGTYPHVISLFLPTLFVYFGLTLILPNVSTLATSHSVNNRMHQR